MAEDFVEFTIELEDKVSGPSDDITGALQEIIKTLKETQAAMVGLKKVEPPVIVKPGMLARISKGMSGVISKLESAVFWTVKWGLAAAGGAVVTLGTMITKGVVSMGIFADASRRAFSSLTGSEAKGEEAFERSRKLAELLGEDVVSVTDSMKGLMAMQFKPDEADELIRISADLKAITGHAEATQRAITAITQIKAKGKLQSEELVGQLAEAGVSTVLVYDELAKSLGKSQAEVRQMLGKGQITADVGIKAIKDAIKKKVHEKTAGEAAVEFSNQSLSGLMQRLSNLPNTLFGKVADHLRSEFDETKDILRDIIGDLNTIDTKKVAGFVADVLRLLKQAVPLVKEFAGGFMEAFSVTFDIAGPEDMAKNLATARDAGKALAKALGLAWDIAKDIAKAMLWLTTDDVGKWVGWLLVGLYALIKISGWVTAIRGGMVALGAVSGGAGAAGGGAAAGWLAPLVGFLVSLPGLILIATAAIVALSWTFREELGKMYLAASDWAFGSPERYGDNPNNVRGMPSKDVTQWKKPAPSEDPFYAGPTAPLGMYQPPPGTGTAPPLPTPQPAIVPPPAQNFSSNIVVNMSVAETQGKTPNELGQTVADKVLDVQSSFYENQNASYGGLMSSPEGP